MESVPGALAQVTGDQVHAAKVAAAGGWGALVFMHLRHPGSLVHAGGCLLTGVGTASFFTTAAAAACPGWVPLGEVQIAAVLGVLGVPLWLGAVKAVERFDFGGLVKRKG